MSFRVSDGAEGRIGGALAASDVAKIAAQIALATKWCPEATTRDVIARAFRDASDVVFGAAQFQDVTRTCDAVSIGLGFVAERVAAPTKVVSAPTPPVSACP